MDDHPLFWARSARACRSRSLARSGIRQRLPFYFFDLPFYSHLLGLLARARVRLATVVYWLAARGWMVRKQMQDFRDGTISINIENFRLRGGLEPLLLRVLVALVSGRARSSRVSGAL